MAVARGNRLPRPLHLRDGQRAAHYTQQIPGEEAGHAFRQHIAAARDGDLVTLGIGGQQHRFHVAERRQSVLSSTPAMRLWRYQRAEHTDQRGQRAFGPCAPCHSLEPDRNMTGPSLACLWGRKAGSLPSFERYSDALKSSGIIWDDRSLDAKSDPQPHNLLLFLTTP